MTGAYWGKHHNKDNFEKQLERNKWFQEVINELCNFYSQKNQARRRTTHKVKLDGIQIAHQSVFWNSFD